MTFNLKIFLIILIIIIIGIILTVLFRNSKHSNSKTPPKTNWKCNASTGVCSKDPKGPFSTQKKCIDKCPNPKPGTQYACNASTGVCSKDPKGPFSTQKKCIDKCPNPKPGTQYACNASTGVCSKDPKGPFSTQKKCIDKCPKPQYVCNHENGYMCDPIPTGKSVPVDGMKVYTSKEKCAKSEPTCGDGSCGDHGKRTQPPYKRITGAPCKCTEDYRGVLCNIPPQSGYCYGYYPLLKDYEPEHGWRNVGTKCYTADRKKYIKACGYPNPSLKQPAQGDKCAGGPGTANLLFTDPADGKTYPAFKCWLHSGSTLPNKCIMNKTTHGGKRPPKVSLNKAQLDRWMPLK